jgi:hypothetical protein
MPSVDERVSVLWQEPTTEAHWRTAAPPEEAATLEDAVRSALGGEAVEHEVLVIFRRDGTRWRVQAEYGGALGASPDADTRSTLDLTRKVVEALRRAGVPAEPGFSGDPHEPRLPVEPLE